MEENLSSVLRSVLKEVEVQTVEELNPTVLASKLNKSPMGKIVID